MDLQYFFKKIQAKSFTIQKIKKDFYQIFENKLFCARNNWKIYSKL